MTLPKLYLKDEVKINGAHFYPEMTRIVDALRVTAPKLSDNAVWITSANDGKHMAGSLHYKNRAFDVRIWNILDDTAEAWVGRLKAMLGKDYDIVLEKDHIHLEYQPKET